MKQPNRESLEITIGKIIKNNILLPDFQRQFVWKDEDAQCKLVASVLTKMPLGSILLLSAEDASEYACKPLGLKTKLDSAKIPRGKVEFLLDGQQRMTVLTNVFSDAIFNLSNQAGDLTAPGALKRRFFLEIPKFENTSVPDLFGVRSLDCPIISDAADPEFLTADVLPFIKVISFNVTKDQDKSYNPYNKKPSKMSELETYCMGANPDFFYIPLFLLIETGRLSVNHTGLNNIVTAIARSVCRTKVSFLKERLEAEPCWDVRKYVTENLISDIFESYFDSSCFEKEPEEICKEFERVLETQADSWARYMMSYLNSCISQINLSQIVVEDSQRARAIDIYENLNRGGISLDIFDLVMARVAQVTHEPFYDRLIKNICAGKNYPDNTITSAPAVKMEFLRLRPTYHAAEYFGSYDADRHEILRAYLESFLNVLCIRSYVPSLDPEAYSVELIKKQKKLELSAKTINDNCEAACRALDRACYFFQSRCGIRNLKELNYVLMLPIVACILWDNELYNGELNDRVFNLIEAWYWTSLFSGAYDKDQNQVMINDLKRLSSNIISLKSGAEPDLGWLIERRLKVFDNMGFSDKEFLLMGSVDNDEYPKNVIGTGICQFFLSKGYEDIRFDPQQQPKKLTVFSECARTLQVHHVIPLGTTPSVLDSTKKIRSNKKHLLNSPLNMMYITDEANHAISSKSLAEYAVLIPASAGLGNLGFSMTEVYANATDIQQQQALGNRFDLVKQRILQHINSLL